MPTAEQLHNLQFDLITDVGPAPFFLHQRQGLPDIHFDAPPGMAPHHVGPWYMVANGINVGLFHHWYVFFCRYIFLSLRLMCHHRNTVHPLVTGYPSNNHKRHSTFPGAARALLGENYRNIPLFANIIDPPNHIVRAHATYHQMRLTLAMQVAAHAQAVAAIPVPQVHVPDPVDVQGPNPVDPDEAALAELAAAVAVHEPEPEPPLAPAHTEIPTEEVDDIYLVDEEPGYSTAPSSRAPTPTSNDYAASLVMPQISAASDEVISLPEMPSSSLSPLPNTSALPSSGMSALSSMLDLLSVGSSRSKKKHLRVPEGYPLRDDVAELPRALHVYLEVHGWSSQAARVTRTLAVEASSVLELQEILFHLGMDDLGAQYIARLLLD
jgi:hypothetical protein